MRMSKTIFGHFFAYFHLYEECTHQRRATVSESCLYIDEHPIHHISKSDHSKQQISSNYGYFLSVYIIFHYH